MKQKENIIFDLDGTIIDSEMGITTSVQHALTFFDIHVERESLFPFIGPPLIPSFMGMFDFSEDQAKQAVKHYRAHFNQHGVHNNTFYAGVDGLIKNLYAQNKNLLIATTKPWKSAVEILDSYKLLPYFRFVSGSEMDGSRTDKTEVIKHGLKNAHITNLDSCVMIGDTTYDIVGANNLKMDSIAVLYGFGSREEVEKEKPTHMVETVEDLGLLLGI